MAGQTHAELRSHMFLALFNHGVLELKDAAAGVANQVIVVVIQLGRLVQGWSVTEVPFTRHSGRHKQPQRPVHSRVADRGIHLLHGRQEPINRSVPFDGQKRIENHFPLTRPLQVVFSHVLSEQLSQF
jgi:hypothetical protein